MCIHICILFYAINNFTKNFSFNICSIFFCIILDIKNINEYFAFVQILIKVIINFLLIFRIDSNIEDTEINVEAAHAEILKYFQSVTNNRWLMIKIFAVLIFFFIFFVVFLA